jgi:uncharacterized protein YwqG
MKSFFCRIILAFVVSSTAFTGASFANNTQQNNFEQSESADFERNEATNASSDFNFESSFTHAAKKVCKGKQNIAKESSENCTTVCSGYDLVWSGTGTKRNCVCCESIK